MDEIFSLMMIGSIMIGREAEKRDFSIAGTLATISCVFVQFKDTLEEK